MVTAAVGLLASASAHIGWIVVIPMVAGWSTHSLVAYAVHRFVFHGRRGPLARTHAHHHAFPLEEQLDLVSYFGPMGMIFAAWLLVAIAGGSIAVANGVAAGGCLGYSWFRLIHRLVHVPRRPAFAERYVELHNRHHRDPAVNFSVTLRFWDWVFRTLRTGGGEREHDQRLQPAATNRSERGAVAATPVGDTATAAFPIEITDPCPATDTPRNAFERLWLRWLRDPRDLAFVRLTLRFLLTIPPCAVLLFVAPAWLAAVVAPAYLLLLYGVFGGPALLMMHAVAHRPTFRGPGIALQGLIRYGLPVFFGISPFAYQPHHILMHHHEENAEADVSSTLGHKRTSGLEFARYYLRFLLFGVPHMSNYLARRRLWGTLALMLLGEAAYLVAAYLLLREAPLPAVATTVLPYAATRFFLMAGNWAQHAFIDPQAPGDGVRNSTVLVNAAQNRRCFNDGYHAVHHRYRGMHWADMASHFCDHWREYSERGVIVFDGIPNQQVVWWRLMRRDFGYLADHIVDLGVLPRERAARIALLEERAGCVLIAPKGLLELRERPQQAL
jgi:sterol desaturase/sphingolipid hydroxylase (fatty acid hydroxylase superfamily)